MRVVLIVLSLMTCLTNAIATASPPQAESLVSCINSAAAEIGFHGVVYVRRGDLVVQKPYGMADAAEKMPITAETRFNIGSAAKMFTAVAIARLVDRGEVQLDAPIGNYLADLPPEFARITIAQLLNHTSGLGDYFNMANKRVIDAAISATDLLPLALATSPAFVPGSKRAYSNSGFVVLGAIVEKVSAMSYREFVQKEILHPLGMSHTRFDPQDSAEPMTRMSPNGPLDKLQPSPLRQVRASPAGGIFSTASDMSLLLTALSNGRLVKRETTQLFLEPRADPGGGAGTYGFGFAVQTTPAVRVGHGGGAPGVNAEIALYPDSGWQLIALSNNDPPAASRMLSVLEHAAFSPDLPTACAQGLNDLAKTPGDPPQH